MTTNEKIALLRGEMYKNNLKGYIVPTGDPHISEYVADFYRFRHWISGFTGSAGTFALTDKKSGLWTDGRYYIQAEIELSGSECELYKAYEPGVISYVQFFCNELSEGDRVGVDAKLMSNSAVKNIQREFNKKGIELVVDCDLSYIWEDRPSLPYTKLFVLDEKYTGESAQSKTARLREKFTEAGATAFVTNTLDNIMWLYNVRANDVHCCPFALSYALVTKENAYFYVSDKQLTDEVRAYLDKNGVTVKAYDDVYADLAALGEGDTVALKTASTNYMLYNSAKCPVKETTDFIENMKAVKNETENKNLKNAYLKDCAALVKGFYKIYNAPDGSMTENDVCNLLLEERGKMEGNLGASFDTIAAYKGNAAMMHYSPDKVNSAVLHKEGMLLIDSGGQYIDGTTDITRTLVLGEISEEEKKAYTLTLKGNIAVCNQKFLRGATGSCLDILARQFLWNEGIDYKCGTGHGVGFLLNVHEGPQGFGPRMRYTYPLEEGMNLTVEPGVYVEGKYGIRIENDVVVEKKVENSDGEFLGFDMLSYCPIDTRAVDKSLMTQNEIDWLNNFHSEVYEKLSPYLTDAEKAWLKEETKAI
ncbi:MAG: aminopeptidase P family protein [Clostridia bacterium]|nr:aminopeptidase P family protein [Clostridia bacterium]